MSDSMRWMYNHYIKPNIESQPKSIQDELVFSLVHNELDGSLQEALQAVLAFYAVQGFRLGVRTGVTLHADL